MSLSLYSSSFTLRQSQSLCVVSLFGASKHLRRVCECAFYFPVSGVNKNDNKPTTTTHQLLTAAAAAAAAAPYAAAVFTRSVYMAPPPWLRHPSRCSATHKTPPPPIAPPDPPHSPTPSSALLLPPLLFLPLLHPSAPPRPPAPPAPQRNSSLVDAPRPACFQLLLPRMNDGGRVVGYCCSADRG